MKETYPFPGKSKPRHPNEFLLGTQAEWEEAVFRNAHHFSVFRYFGRGRRVSEVFETFPEALKDAGDDYRALVYVVTLDGRSVCLPRKEWPNYQAIWDERD